MLNTSSIEYARNNLTDFMIKSAARITRDTGIGYIDVQNAPSTYESLCEAFQYTRKHSEPLPVFNGACDNTIYTSREGNLAFRFIHDLYHVILDADFSVHGEEKVSLTHGEKVIQAFGKNSLEYRLYDADTLGQVRYFAKKQSFPENQLEYVLSILK